MADDFVCAFKPGWCRVNFNYFIPETEFDYILSAIEQIAQHGWKLLPFYKFSLKSGQYHFNGVGSCSTTDSAEQNSFAEEHDETNLDSFNRYDSIHSLKDFHLNHEKNKFEWTDIKTMERGDYESLSDRKIFLKKADQVYQNALILIQKMTPQLRRIHEHDCKLSTEAQRYRWFVLGSEVLSNLESMKKG